LVILPIALIDARKLNSCAREDPDKSGLRYAQPCQIGATHIRSPVPERSGVIREARRCEVRSLNS